MKNFFTSLVLFFVVAAVGLVLAKDAIFKFAVEKAVTGVTGFPTHLDSLKYDLPSTLHIEGLQIDNPPGFTEKIFVRIPEIYVALILPELLQGRGIHLPEVRLNIQEVHLEKNREGISNVQLLSSVGGKGGAPKKPEPARPAGPKKAGPPFLLERLELTIRKVTYEDHSGIVGAAPLNKFAVDLGVEKQVFGNITDPQVLVNLILTKILKEATFGRLLNLRPEDLLNQDFSQYVNEGRQLVGQQTKLLGQQVGNLSGQAQGLLTQSAASQKTQATVRDSVGEAKALLGGTTNTAQQKLSGFLGKLKNLQSGSEASSNTQ